MNDDVPLSAESDAGRHHRNAHLLELNGCEWRCLICRHWFDAAVDADLFMCGEDCTGKHPGALTLSPLPEPSGNHCPGCGWSSGGHDPRCPTSPAKGDPS